MLAVGAPRAYRDLREWSARAREHGFRARFTLREMALASLGVTALAVIFVATLMPSNLAYDARCVVFLASDDAGYITGSTISANGGQFVV
jgi:NAD(P)-dependent dehydrogenase (short-subunit alcohol dehydrogenase family)